MAHLHRLPHVRALSSASAFRPVQSSLPCLTKPASEASRLTCPLLRSSWCSSRSHRYC
ncbi:hypothetical protein EI94DRAFT_1750153 [Lactarius quietus]|nr:hypothetical protein EI94DRAFT_1750153 [Lactarius quietus]